jgi:hypothetical protein
MGDAPFGPAPTWAFCGQPLDAHELNFRLRFPDAVVELLDAGQLDVSEIDGDPGHDTAINVGDSWFFRVLLSVHLADGPRVIVGTWLEVEPDALQTVADVWSTPEYRNVVVSGRLANAIPPWGDEVLGAAATATVIDPDHSPYITASEDGVLSRVLDEEWPGEVVLATLPH